MSSDNVLVSVATYVDAALPMLNNIAPLLGLANKKFENFNETVYNNRGTTVTFKVVPQFIAYNTLDFVSSGFQGVQEEVISLTINDPWGIPIAFTNNQLTDTVANDLERFAKSTIAELGTKIEASVSRNVILGHTYRAYGTGTQSLTSILDYMMAVAFLRDTGTATFDSRVIAPNIDVVQVVNTMLNQFVPARNESAGNSWSLGNYNGTDFYTSNLLPTQFAGTCGNNQDVLTLTAVNPDGNQLTFTGVTSNTNCLNAGDIITLDYPGNSTPVGLYFLTYFGHVPSSSKVQVRVTANVSGSTGTVIVPIEPALIFDPTNPLSNINLDLTTLYGTLKAQSTPDHKAGLLYTGDTLFLAMPRLADTDPWKGVTKTDPVTGASVRCYYGKVGMHSDQYGFIFDSINGSTIDPRYAMRLIYPLTTTPGNFIFSREKQIQLESAENKKRIGIDNKKVAA
jgi:hypothetical protein